MDFCAGGVSGGIGGFGTRDATLGACAIEAPIGCGAHRRRLENDWGVILLPSDSPKPLSKTALAFLQYTDPIAL